MKRIKIKLGVLAFASFVFGCGHTWFADPKANPVIEDKVGISGKEVLGTLATTADRRTVIVKLVEAPGSNDIGKFCAEPPPDVAENIVSQIGLLLEADAKIKPAPGETELEGTGKIDFNKLLQTTVQALVKRSQGLQLYRDAMYNYCQAYLNRAISETEFNEKNDEVLIKAYELIKLELELTRGAIGFPEITPPPSPPPPNVQ
jgi:hypothetical protein